MSICEYLRRPLQVIMASFLLIAMLSQPSISFAESHSLRVDSEVHNAKILEKLSSLTQTPSLVKNIQLKYLDPNLKTMTLVWNLNPTKEGVDKFAIYYKDNALNFDKSGGFLVQVVANNSIKMKLFDNYFTSNFIPGNAYITAGNFAFFWVVAHNKFGWGANNAYTLNPDQNPSSSNIANQKWTPPFPHFIIVEFPCTTSAIKQNLCSS